MAYNKSYNRRGYSNYNGFKPRTAYYAQQMRESQRLLASNADTVFSHESTDRSYVMYIPTLIQDKYTEQDKYVKVGVYIDKPLGNLLAKLCKAETFQTFADSMVGQEATVLFDAIKKTKLFSIMKVNKPGKMYYAVKDSQTAEEYMSQTSLI